MFPESCATNTVSLLDLNAPADPLELAVHGLSADATEFVVEVFSDTKPSISETVGSGPITITPLIGIAPRYKVSCPRSPDTSFLLTATKGELTFDVSIAVSAKGVIVWPKPEGPKFTFS